METDRLFRMLAPEAMYQRPIRERHRLVFYLGHLEAFDWNMICRASFGMPAFHSRFDRLFEFGIDPVAGALPQDRPSDWPGVDEILAYSGRVRTAVDDLLDRASFTRAEAPFVENGLIFRVAIEHRLMHAETLAYMLHWLDYDLKRRDDSMPLRNSASRSPSEVRIPAGAAKLGLAKDSVEFGWDNEFQSHDVLVPEFSIDAFNVTNREFAEFVRSGGYEHRSLWTREDWEWVQSEEVRHPKFWIARGDGWLYRTMFDEIPLPQHWPVYVSHAEACAYARWKGKSLPTESQYQRAAFGDESESAVTGGNLNFKSWFPDPVGAGETRNAYGVFDLIGNGWEWTSTPFAPFAGFEPFPFYPGYSADFFDGKHFVLKGASPRTASLLVRRSFRNWFQPHYPNIYATFRCVQQ
jgi:ergothioneine biosynthesis protein EgtB